MKEIKDRRPALLFALILLSILFIGLFTPMRGALSRRFEAIYSRFYLKDHQPEKMVFIPQESGISTVDVQRTPEMEATVTVEPSASPSPSPAPDNLAAIPTLSPAAAEPSPSPTLTAHPTATPEPLPASWRIQGVKYEDQHGVWNYCAPTNLSMAMTFWGWRGDRMDIGPFLKPFNKDKNVMFSEMETFVAQRSDLRSLVRAGGEPDTLKRLLSNGFPVLIEKGSFMQEVSGAYSWMGHYNVITGYDDERAVWIVQDSYYKPDYQVAYDLLETEWRAFNYQFMLVYPPELEARLFEVLGPYTNGSWAINQSLRKADAEIEEAADSETLTFAYFNRGSAYVEKQDYYAAAASYDMAFKIYEEIEKNRRPYRLVWYQTGPYAAYYYTGRYNDVINLANITLSSTKEPYLEESLFWRAKANLSLENYAAAQDDLYQCLKLHEGFAPCLSLLNSIGS